MQESRKRDTIEFSKKATAVRDFLNIKGDTVNSRVVDAAIRAVMKGDRDLAKKYILQKLTVDATNDHSYTLGKVTGEETPNKKPTPEYVAEQILEGIELKLEELKEKEVATPALEEKVLPPTEPEKKDDEPVVQDSTETIPQEDLSDPIVEEHKTTEPQPPENLPTVEEHEIKDSIIEKHGAINVRTDDKIDWEKEPIIPKRTEGPLVELTPEEKATYTKIGSYKPENKSEDTSGENPLSNRKRKTSAHSEKVLNAIFDDAIEKNKEKLDSLHGESILEITSGTTVSRYKVRSVENGVVRYTTGGDPTERETTIEKLKALASDLDATFTIEKDTEKEKLAQFDTLMLEMKEYQKSWNPDASEYEKTKFLQKMFQELNIPVASIEPVYTKEELAEKEKARLAYEEREKMIQEIGELLKQGIDKIVIHGQTIEIEDDVSVKAQFGQSIDADSRGALYFLSLAQGVPYNEGSYTRITHKGGRGGGEETELEYTVQTEDGKEKTLKAPVSYSKERKEVKERTKLYIDTSGEKLSFKFGESGKEIFIDHHQTYFSKYQTSATALMYEVLTKNNMIETEPWMKDMSDFITNVDNLSYTNEKGLNEKSLRNEWSETLFAIYENVPFEKIVQWFKEGKNPHDPQFTKEELDEVLTIQESNKKDPKKTLSVPKKLSQIIEEKRAEIGVDISRAKIARTLMEMRGIATENKWLGTVIYNKQDKQGAIKEIDGDRNDKNFIKNGFITTKALGCETYVTYNEQYHRFMVNSNTRNLKFLYEKIKKIIPEVVLVRGVMLMQPTGHSKRKAMTEKKFLKLLGLIENEKEFDKNTYNKKYYSKAA